MSTQRKKLIEVALPLEAINLGSKPETENPFLKGHPRSVHNWWARTPLSVSRAILFAQLIDDPGNELPPEKAASARESLLEFVAQLATWEATRDERILEQARDMIRRQFGGDPPAFWDMFAGRASIPLEAQRLGLAVTSTDLNPVAVTIQRVLLEFPSIYRNRPPTHPLTGDLLSPEWRNAEGLSADVRWYGKRVEQVATERLQQWYPEDQEHGPIGAWIWARTVTCPNPACRAPMPLVRSFKLSGKKGKKAYLHPIVDREQRSLQWAVQHDSAPRVAGTVDRKGANCLFCKSPPVNLEYVRSEGKAGRISHTLLSTVTIKSKQFLPPTREQVQAAETATPKWCPDTELPERALGFRVQLYGMNRHRDLFTQRQLTALTVLCDVIKEIRDEVEVDSGGDSEYANAIAFYLGCALSRLTDYHNNLCTWNPTNENVGHLFQRQAVPIVWDYVEANPICGPLSFAVAADWVSSSLQCVPGDDAITARVFTHDARENPPRFEDPPVISTDPPYYDNIGYADLSDFFYTWLRSLLKDIDPHTFSTVLSPKEPELIASNYRHEGSSNKAEQHFREGFAAAFHHAHAISRRDVPLTVYYAFKQQESQQDGKTRSSTGWETMLEGLVNAGFQITGTWPVRTTKKARSVARGTNALASAVVLVARQRAADAERTGRRGFLAELKKELPVALRELQSVNIAPVDLAQAAIGPGMAVYSKYAAVLESNDAPLGVRSALELINQVLDEVLGEQEGELDRETLFALTWYQEHGFQAGPYGDAETLAKARNVSVTGAENAGILRSAASKTRLLRRDDLPADWSPSSDPTLTVWECTQHLIRRLEEGGESAAAELVREIGPLADAARALAYRLYTICERKRWAEEARAYNGLVVAWPEIEKLAEEAPAEAVKQSDLFEGA